MATRFLFAALLLATTSTPAAAADSLGIFERWGAFRDAGTPLNCYAIARANGQSRANAPGYVSIGFWPASRIRGQFYARLSRGARASADVTVTIGQASFDLVGNGRNYWAKDARTDAAMVAAIRSANSMEIRSRAANGARFTDRYALSGAATAIDAAALGCARRR